MHIMYTIYYHYWILVITSISQIETAHRLPGQVMSLSGRSQLMP